MTHFLVFWKSDTVASSQGHSPMLKHSASYQYGKLNEGDILWIVTSEESEDLVLVGRQRDDRVVSRHTAELMLEESKLWNADYYAISDEPDRKENIDISRYAFDLSFDGDVESFPEGFTGQHMQQMRRLDFDSADLLEQIWNQRFNAS